MWWILLLLLGSSVDDATQRGHAAYQRGDLSTALTEWGTALKAARDAGDTEAEFDLLLRLGAVNRQLGRLATAEAALDRAEGLGGDAGRLYLDRGLLELARGDARKAEARFDKAFRTYQGDSRPAGAATAALDLGVARLYQGRNADARKALQGALDLYGVLSDQGGEAAAAVQLARVDRAEGQDRQALARVDEAIGAALLARELGTVTEAQLLRGQLLRQLGREEAAVASYQAALDGARKRKDVRTQARLYNALAGLQHASADPRARETYRAAEEGFLAVGDEVAALEVAVNASALYGADEAVVRRLLERARRVGAPRLEATLALNLATLGDDAELGAAGKLVDSLGLAELRWRHRYLSGKAAIDAGRSSAGVKLLQEAVDELERRRRGLGDDASGPFLTKHQDVYQLLVDTLMAQGDSAGAFVYAQRLAALDVTPASNAKLDTLAAEEQWISDEVGRARDPEQRAALAKRLGELRVEFAHEVDLLRSTHRDFEAVARMDPEDLEAIQAELPTGVTVLQPLLFEDQLALLVFSRESLVARTVPVDGAEVRKTILRLSRSLQAAHTRDPAWTDRQADALGELFIAPVHGALSHTETLVISATGALREVPFAMVRHEGRYLVEDMAVVGVTHVGSLSRRSPPFRLDPEGVLLVGNPDGTLKGAEDEVARIRARIPSATSLIGSEGTRQAFESAVSGKQVVHLATHGVIDRDQPNASYLVLHGDADEGRLPYREIPGLAPVLGRCRLVVLSACQSGLAVDAKRPTDPEGGIVVSINGLAAQFRRAGVETLIASLWRVDDTGTQALMTALYDELASGSDIARSLQRAQLRLLADEKTRHPWYWAAFVTVGDWR